jgi:hypothetical protein
MFAHNAGDSAFRLEGSYQPAGCIDVAEDLITLFLVYIAYPDLRNRTCIIVILVQPCVVVAIAEGYIETFSGIFNPD